MAEETTDSVEITDEMFEELEAMGKGDDADEEADAE